MYNKKKSFKSYDCKLKKRKCAFVKLQKYILFYEQCYFS